MPERFTKDARTVVTRAEDEARDAGSRTIEAEHLLLAASGAVGLDRRTIEDALAAEWAASLARAGVDRVPPPPVRFGGRMRFGASAKTALAESVRLAAVRKQKLIGPRHIVRGVISARGGRVPRALDLAGIDTFALWRD